jgi:hypothetical protein
LDPLNGRFQQDQVLVIQNVIDIESDVTEDLKARDVSGRPFQQWILFIRHNECVFDLEFLQHLKDFLGLEPLQWKAVEHNQLPFLTLQ